MKPHQDLLNIDVNSEVYQRFLFNRIVYRDEIDFYKLSDSVIIKKCLNFYLTQNIFQIEKEEFKLIHDNDFRGFCSFFYQRQLINSLIKGDSPNIETIKKE